MTDRRPDPVTGEDIRGLREATKGLTHSVDEFATKQDVQHERDDRRKELAYAVIVALASLILVYVFAIGPARHAADQAQGALNAFVTEQADAAAKSAAQTFDRRVADCHSLDDVGTAIKSGLTVLPNDPRYADFIASYNAAIDAAITTAKTRKGYSADCTQIGAPPVTNPGG